MIKIVIMAHPKRKDLANSLFFNLIKGFENVEIVWDRENNEWDTGKRCLQAAQGEWTVIIQDDAVIGGNFCQNVENYLSKAPKTLTSFYFGGGKPRDKEARECYKMAKERGCDLIRLSSCYWGVCLAIPTVDCQELAKINNNVQYDNRIGQFYRLRGVMYTVPSLCDHSDCQTLIKDHGQVKRKAIEYSNEPLEFNYKVLKTEI